MTVHLRPALILVEAAAGFVLLATVGDTIAAAITGALVAAVPTLFIMLKERRKDRAEVKHIESSDDLAYAEMVSRLLAEKAEWAKHRCQP